MSGLVEVDVVFAAWFSATSAAVGAWFSSSPASASDSATLGVLLR